MEQNSLNKLEALKARIATGKRTAQIAWIRMEANVLCLKSLRIMAA